MFRTDIGISEIFVDGSHIGVGAVEQNLSQLPGGVTVGKRQIGISAVTVGRSGAGRKIRTVKYMACRAAAQTVFNTALLSDNEGY